VITPRVADRPITAGVTWPDIITGGALEAGTGVSGLTGIGFPGITSAPRFPDRDVLLGDSLWGPLADFTIPDDEIELYAEAPHGGRSIVAHHGTAATATLIEELFRNGGLMKVKTF
jgi:hypothetical protein